jgi:soluble lytic murein transglycosylase
VSRWLVSGEQPPLDLFVARIPYDETRGYVMRVLSNWARYSYLDAGESAVQVPSLELPKDLKLGDGFY